jgi:hypothetical protein
MTRHLKENGLSVFFSTIFLAAIVGQSFAGQHAYNAEQVEHGESPVPWWGYVRSASFWGAVMENWQSEFLAVGTMAAFTIYLRQRGSPESKPVGAPHDETGSSG